jgi:hypothetical protein
MNRFHFTKKNKKKRSVSNKLPIMPIDAPAAILNAANAGSFPTILSMEIIMNG